jgi:hypothetical protein
MRSQGVVKRQSSSLVVLNAEAHHVHDADLAWSQSLLNIHRALPKGLALWLDFSATPKDQHGMYFPWTVCNYPLAQVVEDRIVKAPLIATNEDDAKQPMQDPDHITGGKRLRQVRLLDPRCGAALAGALPDIQALGDTTSPVHYGRKERLRRCDCCIPVEDLDPAAFEAIYDQAELEETFRINLKLEFATTETEVHQADLAAGTVPMAQELLRSITSKVLQRAKLPTAFAKLYPLVRTYVTTRCFGKTVDVDSEAVRAHLRRLELQEGIARYLARKIAALTVEKHTIEFEKADFQLSDTKPFSWRRNLLPQPLEANRTVFNYVATYNDFERRFAQFLDAVPDVLRFASLGTTEQGESGTLFRIDYLKPSGAIGFYYPDWVAVQRAGQGEVNWIIETKGRVWEDTAAKDAAMRDWCTRISQQTGQRWEYARVNRSDFEAQKPLTLMEATQTSGQESGSMTR